VKRIKQRQQPSLISDAVRYATPVNVASDNEFPPVLELPELKHERMLLYPTPPYINPGFCFDSAAIKIKDRAGKYIIGTASFYMYIWAKFMFK
jgi:hypothetical protein